MSTDTPAQPLRAAAQAVLDRWDSPKWEWQSHGPTADLMADLRKALAASPQPTAAPVAELVEALRIFVGCALPVSTEIDKRGHRWTEAYLDQALPIGIAALERAALSRAPGAGMPNAYLSGRTRSA